MTADTDTTANETPGTPGNRRRNALVYGALLIVVATLGWLERMPEALYWPMRVLFAAAVSWLAYAAVRALLAIRFEARKVVFSLVLLAIVYGSLHLLCHVFVKIMSARDERLTITDTSSLTKRARRGVEALLAGESYSVYDREIGWVPRPGYQWKMHSINAQGLRGPRQYPETPPDPSRRILCIGDSFTFGYEVEDDQTYPYHGEQLLPGTEWINLGNCGSGLTQSLHQYRKHGRKFGGKYIVIGFMTNNNKRTVNCFRPFISPHDTGTPFTKPFAKLVDGDLTLQPNPYQELSDYRKLLENESGELARLRQLDYLTWSRQRGSRNPVLQTAGYIWERRNGKRSLDILLNRPVDDSLDELRKSADPYKSSLWHPDSIGFQTILKVFDLYYNEVIADRRVPLIVILPSAGDVDTRARGGRPKHAALLSHLDKTGYRYFDFLDILEDTHKEKLSTKTLFVKTHFAGETNRRLAREITRALGLTGKEER